MPYEGPGGYRHYKGGEYLVLGLAVREETKEDGWVTEVVYQPVTEGSLLEGRPESFWTRVLADFDAEVTVGGAQVPVPRFWRVF